MAKAKNKNQKPKAAKVAKPAKVSKKAGEATRKPVKKKKELSEPEKAMVRNFANVFLDAKPITFIQDEDDNTLNIDGKDQVLLRAQFFHSTGVSTYDGAMKLLNQAFQSHERSNSLKNANATADFLNGINPKDPIEGMLATQMIAMHNLAMHSASQATREGLMVDFCETFTRLSTKAASVFAKQVEALSKYRNKGQQTIQVQHVNVNDGGQAVVGNVSQGGGANAKKAE